jgi:uridine kinase
MTAPRKVLLVGIGGGTASGKTSIARKVQESIGQDQSALIELDSYYHELSRLPVAARAEVNFDHPGAFDFDLLLEHLGALLAGQSIRMPLYDYVNHNRKTESVTIEPRPLIVVEGILALWHEDVRNLLDIKVYVDAADDLRLVRRIRRDIVERGRVLETVLRQYEEDVRPSHLEFCEPTKLFADVIIPRGGENAVAIEMVRSLIHSRFRGA